MPAAIAALLLLLLPELPELRPKSKSARHPRSTQMPFLSNPHVRLRWHGAFDSCRRSVTLFSVSTRQKLRLLFRLSQRIVPRAAQAGGAAGTATASTISVAAARVGNLIVAPEVGESADYLTGNARNPAA